MTDEILSIVKTLRGIAGDDQDGLLGIYIDMTIQSILNHCNIYEFPSELKYVVVNMISDMLDESSGDAPISSVSEQGASVSFDRATVKMKIEDRVSSMSQLNQFRNLYKVKPPG